MTSEPRNSASQPNFLTRLSANLHELAQPLSIIQASLELALLSPITLEQYQDVTRGVLHDLQRSVECLQFVACLTRFQQPAKDVQEIALGAVLEGVISDLQCTLEAAELQVLFSRPERDPAIRISAARLRQLFFYVLQAAQDCGQPGDLIQIEVRERAGHVVLLLEQSKTAEPAGSAGPLAHDAGVKALALAEAIVSSAGGEFSVATHPLRVVADFPGARERGAKVVDNTVNKNHEETADVGGLRLGVVSG